MIPSLATLAVPLLAAAGLLSAPPRQRPFALSGTLPVALALASLSVAAAPVAGLEGLPQSYLAITAGLLLVGGGMLAGPGVFCLWRSPASPVHPLIRLVALTGIAVVAGVIVVPLLRAGGMVPSVAAAVALGSAAVVLVVLARVTRLGDGVRWLDRMLLQRPSKPAAEPRNSLGRWALAVQAATAAVALVAGQLDLLLAASLTGVAAGVILRRQRVAGWGGAWAAAAVAATLLPAWYLLGRVAGPMPHSLVALREAPYSPAFEVLVALLLLGGGWVLLGLWPFHGGDLGPMAPLLGAAVIARLAGGLTPAGLEHWQPAFAPLAAVAAWHAASSGRVEAGMIALGTLGLLAAVNTAGAAGTALVGAGVVVDLLRRVEEAGHRLEFPGRLLIGAGLVGATALFQPVIATGLRVQLVYTVATVLGATAAVGFGRWPWQAK